MPERRTRIHPPTIGDVARRVPISRVTSSRTVNRSSHVQPKVRGISQLTRLFLGQRADRQAHILDRCKTRRGSLWPVTCRIVHTVRHCSGTEDRRSSRRDMFPAESIGLAALIDVQSL
jgi:hypothetical protein